MTTFYQPTGLVPNHRHDGSSTVLLWDSVSHAPSSGHMPWKPLTSNAVPTRSLSTLDTAPSPSVFVRNVDVGTSAISHSALSTAIIPSQSVVGNRSPAGYFHNTSHSSPSASVFTGDLTHYNTGLGSCGWKNDDSQPIVALPHAIMQGGWSGNSNDNPLCGKNIAVSYQGRTHFATIVDTCGGCNASSIDVSPTLFSVIAPRGNGRVHDVQWWFE